MYLYCFISGGALSGVFRRYCTSKADEVGFQIDVFT